MKIKLTYFFGLVLILIILFSACKKREKVETPKPKGYYRIELPTHNYQLLDTIFPFRFYLSKYATCNWQQKEDKNYWIVINYKLFNADINLSYAPLKNDLRERIIEEEKMISFHYKIADDVEFSIISDPSSHIFGQMYDIKGTKVATPLSFWISDSSQHFLRGSLYFNNPPNNDSLQPVIQYIREDLLEMINRFEWK